MKVLFACSGTAGHVNPALAIAAAIKKLVTDVEFLFIGAGRDIENKLIPQAGYELINIKMSGLQRKFSIKMIAHNLITAKNLALSGRRVKKIISQFSPDVAIGTGGYICYPVLKKASKMNIPSLIHESNAIPGLTTRMLSDVVDKVVVAFPGLEEQYKRPERVTFKGTPVLVEKRERPGEGNGKKKEKPLIVSFWGSLGAERLNEMMPEFIKLMVEDGKYRLIHAAGKQEELEKIEKALKQLGLPEVLLPEIEIREYIDNMPDILPTANLVLCRAGGSTIAELAELQKPAVLIPSPHVSNNEQAENAKSFVKMGGAVSISEENCSGAVLYETVSAILAVDDKLEKMSEALKSANVSNAALSIAELAVGLVKTGSSKKERNS